MKRKTHVIGSKDWSQIQSEENSYDKIVGILREKGFAFIGDKLAGEVTSHSNGNGGRVFVQESQYTGNPIFG